MLVSAGSAFVTVLFVSRKSISLTVRGRALVQSVKGKSSCPHLLPKAMWFFSYTLSLRVNEIGFREIGALIPIFPFPMAWTCLTLEPVVDLEVLDFQASSLHIHPREDCLTSSTCAVSI